MTAHTHTHTHTHARAHTRALSHTHMLSLDLTCAQAHTHIPSLDLTCAQAHTHISGRASYSTFRSAFIVHTHTSSYLLEIWLMMTHSYPCPRLIACTNTYFSFTCTGAFPLHTCAVTRNLRIYFTSVRRVFLVETVVLQTIL